MRFNCTCPATYTGQRCEKKITYPKSCKDIAESGNLASGNYIVYDSLGVTFSVYCGFEESNTGFAWTMIQSFSFSKKNLFYSDKEFSTDCPINNNLNQVDWTEYRLSLSQMQSIADHSTHFRATCNYLTDGLDYTDYARAKLEGYNIFETWDEVCKHYEYLNIRGLECHDCTALTKQKPGKAWFINSDISKLSGCDFDGSQGSVSNENNFGRYRSGTVNPAHRCSALPASTTQYWFGAIINL